jgi:ribosome-binding factor A
MESMRQQKMAKEVQKELSDIFLKRQQDLFPGQMATITQVKMTPDLGIARVYLSIFPLKNITDIFEKIELQSGEIRKVLGNRMGKRVRKIPELAFFHDDTEEEAQRIDRLIDNLNIPPSTDSDS